MKKLNFFGAGPKIALLLLPYLFLVLIITFKWHNIFAITGDGSNVLTISGIVMVVTGFVFYVSAVLGLKGGLKDTRLVTNGAYYFCQNPLYSSIILFIIPGVSFWINSWLVLTAAIAGYVVFKVSIRKEYLELGDFFGEEYLNYRNKTPEFFPFPLKKLFNNN
jgi:protein-S-isoprenylcysteine O-methyltransferase Ste14